MTMNYSVVCYAYLPTVPKHLEFKGFSAEK